jgi:hypothetical protein
MEHLLQSRNPESDTLPPLPRHGPASRCHRWLNADQINRLYCLWMSGRSTRHEKWTAPEQPPMSKSYAARFEGLA